LTPISAQHARVLSGMRPTGPLHLGHFHGVLKNWLDLQHEYECFFFVADWHALTTHYDDPTLIPESTREMVIDWLAAGINPGSALHRTLLLDLPQLDQADAQQQVLAAETDDAFSLAERRMRLLCGE